jgi:hypothetical protein
VSTDARAPIAVVLLALALAFGVSGSACKSEPTEVEKVRRELLTPPDYPKMRAERKEKQRLLDDEGLPIPSDQVLAGLPIPRGFTLTRSF